MRAGRQRSAASPLQPLRETVGGGVGGGFGDGGDINTT